MTGGKNSPTPAVAEKRIVSFDGGSASEARVVRPDRYREIRMPASLGPRICLGAGTSYAPLGFGSGGLTVDTSRFNRLLAFDSTTGDVECEAGTSLGALHRFLAPRGFFLTIQPGYPGITIGGCVAADVHGKNQFRDGNFRSQVVSLRLFHPRHGDVDLSLSREPAVFELTCGGLGLTGTILTVRLKALRLPAASVWMVRQPLASFDGVLDALTEIAPASDFLYTWHDFTRDGPAFGKGFVVRGSFASGEEDLASSSGGGPGESEAMALPFRRGRFFPPFLNRHTAKPFNSLYGLLQRIGPRRRRVSIFDFLFPVARKMFYFDLFGESGFHEVQWIIPRGAVPALSRELPRLLRRFQTRPTLASCKIFEGTPALLRFDGSGLCLALDFPRGSDSEALLAALDSLGRDLGVIPNVAKDSRLPAGVARAGLPGFSDFQTRLLAWDPDRLYRSETSERLGL